METTSDYAPLAVQLVELLDHETCVAQGLIFYSAFWKKWAATLSGLEILLGLRSLQVTH